MILAISSVKKATSKSSLKAISWRDVMVSAVGAWVAGGALGKARGRLPCAAFAMSMSWEGLGLGKELPSGLLVYENGAAETAVRYEKPMIDAILKETIMTDDRKDAEMQKI